MSSKILKKNDYPGLPKWPGLLVVGDNVTFEQASIINVRTSSFHWSTNNRRRIMELNTLIKVPNIELYSPNTSYKSWQAYEDAFEAAYKRYQVLDLDYLRNWNIVSSYVYGPHGWCAWDGTIGCNSFNVGKWPSVEGIENEWKLIAAAFPFLSLRCQLLSEETCIIGEHDARPLVEYVVKGGHVEVISPNQMLVSPEQIMNDNKKSLDSFCLDYADRRFDRECGCSVKHFKTALKLTETSLRA